MRINRGGRAYVPSATKTVGIRPDSPKRKACPDCEAYPFMSCRVWREEDGVRYVVRTKVTYCDGRKS